MHQSAIRYVVLHANVGSNQEPWASRRVWSTGTLENKVGEIYEDLRDSYRKKHGLDKTEDAMVFMTGLSELDNELPNQYEQPPAPQQPAAEAADGNEGGGRCPYRLLNRSCRSP